MPAHKLTQNATMLILALNVLMSLAVVFPERQKRKTRSNGNPWLRLFRPPLKRSRLLWLEDGIIQILHSNVGDIEDVLKTVACIHRHKWNSMMIKRVYFGYA